MSNLKSMLRFNVGFSGVPDVIVHPSLDCSNDPQEP